MTQTGCGWGVQQRARLSALVPGWVVGVLIVNQGATVVLMGVCVAVSVGGECAVRVLRWC